MSSPPDPVWIYHITHVDNLPAILAGDRGLLSDAEMIKRGGPAMAVGLSDIKQRRLTLPVKCHSGLCVGDCVPFFFCPRSIMLYILHRANRPELTYRGGQDPIVHLEVDLEAAMARAEADQSRYAFSLSNASADYAEFRADPAQLDEVNWAAVANDDFTSSDVREGKQAEFLIETCVPWELVRRVGVRTEAMRARVAECLADHAHQPPVDVLPQWYF